MVTKTKLVPPDGGYGWFVAGAYALHQFVAVPTMQIYGLLFKDAFNDLGFSATDTTFVMNTHVAISMFMGIVNGPLLKRFGYRKMSIIGAFLFTLGIVATSFAQTHVQYIITFSTIAAIGVGIGLASYPVAFNTYFLKKRARSAGFALAISAFGIVVMPQIISFLLSNYGMKGAVLIMGSLTSHVFIAAVLLQPVKRHMKSEVIIVDDPKETPKDKLLATWEEFEDDVFENNRQQLSLENELEIESKYSVSTPFGSLPSLHSSII
ncbi:membrane transporter [Oryctes borbonicus]|uniref:Membrane transporter n=1 Tax=Oryctes borbonicus TaxID=1629725 RepID=A0A0T6AZ21_9SCAR|nr:membrane transporter [Oryctes borbonicus]